MKKIIKLFLFFLAFYFLLSFSLQTHAQAPEPTPSGNDTLNQIAGQFGTAVVETGLSGNDPRAIVMSVVKVALGLVAIIFLVLIVYAGYTWMTAGGDQKKVETAQKYIKNSVFGLVIILLAYSVVLLISLFALRSTTDIPGQTPSQLGPGFPTYK